MNEDLSILIVEDNSTSRQVMTHLLYSLGFHNVMEAEDGREAFDKISMAPKFPDIILCDWQMPNVDGLTLLRELRARDMKSIFVMVTATDSIEAAILAKTHGVDGYLKKPVTKANLHKAIESALDRANLRQSR